MWESTRGDPARTMRGASERARLAGGAGFGPGTAWTQNLGQRVPGTDVGRPPDPRFEEREGMSEEEWLARNDPNSPHFGLPAHIPLGTTDPGQQPAGEPAPVTGGFGTTASGVTGGFGTTESGLQAQSGGARDTEIQSDAGDELNVWDMNEPDRNRAYIAGDAYRAGGRNAAYWSGSAYAGQGFATRYYSPDPSQGSGDYQNQLRNLFLGSGVGSQYADAFDLEWSEHLDDWIMKPKENINDTEFGRWIQRVNVHQYYHSGEDTALGHSGGGQGSAEAASNAESITLGMAMDYEARKLRSNLNRLSPEELQVMESDGTRGFMTEMVGQGLMSNVYGDDQSVSDQYGEAGEATAPGGEAGGLEGSRISDEESEANARAAAERLQASVGRSLRGLYEKMGARGMSTGQMMGLAADAGTMGSVAVSDAANRSRMQDRMQNLQVDMAKFSANQQWNLALLQGELREEERSALFAQNLQLQKLQEAAQARMMKLQQELNKPTTADRFWQLLGTVTGAAASAGGSALGMYAYDQWG